MEWMATIEIDLSQTMWLLMRQDVKAYLELPSPNSTIISVILPFREMVLLPYARTVTLDHSTTVPADMSMRDYFTKEVAIIALKLD